MHCPAVSYTLLYTVLHCPTLSCTTLHCTALSCSIPALYCTEESWGRILGRNTDKCLKSFPPCYSQSPLQLWLKISISSNSRNLLQFLVFSYCYCTLYRRKRENLIGNHTPSLWFKKSTQKPQVWEVPRICPETTHEFGFGTVQRPCQMQILVLCNPKIHRE